MNYELELLEIFGLENQIVHKLELTFEPFQQVTLKAKISPRADQMERITTLLKKYEVLEATGA